MNQEQRNKIKEWLDYYKLYHCNEVAVQLSVRNVLGDNNLQKNIKDFNEGVDYL